MKTSVLLTLLLTLSWADIVLPDNDSGTSSDAEDADGDGVIDSLDNCPQVANSDQTDTDGDGLGNACDADDDGDGVVDSQDSWPLEAEYSVDADSDGLADEWEVYHHGAIGRFSASDDRDADGLTELNEFQIGTNPRVTDTDADTLPDGWEVTNQRAPLMADYQIEVGSYNTCVLDDVGVTCTGTSYYGTTSVPEMTNPFAISVGTFAIACAIDDEGVHCWGQLGEQSTDYGHTEVPPLINPTKVSAGGYHACALDDTGVVCWGRDDYGQSSVPNLSNPRSISAGAYHSCAIDDSGPVCWGYDGYGETSIPNWVSDQLIPGARWQYVFAGYYGTCAAYGTSFEKDLFCWGRDAYGVGSLQPPDRYFGGARSADFDDTLCYIPYYGANDAAVVCFGRNGNGQASAPASLKEPVAVNVGGLHSCALDKLGFHCWGSNVYNPNPVPAFVMDPDQDGYSGSDDAFHLDATEHLDTDSDGIGNNADADDDGDSVPDAEDMFPLDSAEWVDTDGDGIGNNADTDDDGDGLADEFDAFPLDPTEQIDSDEDGTGDNSDNCPSTPNGLQLNSDSDTLGDACDTDDDNDGLSDAQEESLGTNPLLADSDGDGWADGEEIENGADPLSATSQPEPVQGLPVWLLYEATRTQ